MRGDVLGWARQDRTGEQQAATLGGDVIERLWQLLGKLRREPRCAGVGAKVGTGLAGYAPLPKMLLTSA